MGEFMAIVSLFAITITTFWAKFYAPLLCNRMSLMYFFLIVTLKRMFWSWSQLPSSSMNLLTASELFAVSLLSSPPLGD